MALSGSVFEIWHVTDRQTDRQTDRHPHRFMIWPHVVGHIINEWMNEGIHVCPILQERITRPRVLCVHHIGLFGCTAQFLSRVSTLRSRVSTLTREIDIVILSICPLVRNAPVSDKNGLTYRHSFFLPYGRPIILVLPASNIFTKFRRGHPLWGR